jgi:putative DNA primase/helicase
VAAIFAADAVAVAWELAGDLLTPDRSIQKAVLLLGDGSNGKSTFLAGLRAFIGRRNTSAYALHKLENERFSAGQLLGKLANICPDLPSAHLESTSTFKTLTGGDETMGEFKFKDAFLFEPYCRLIFSANHPPESADASEAFFRRWLVIPFERVFQEPDQAEPGAAIVTPRATLDAALADPAEQSGLLNHALDGLRRVRARGAFSESASMRAARETFREATDPVSVWIARALVEDSDGAVPCQDVIRGYNEAAHAANRPTESERVLSKALQRRFRHLDRRERILATGGPKTYCYLGINWRPAPASTPGSASPHSPLSPLGPYCFLSPSSPPNILTSRARACERIGSRGESGECGEALPGVEAGAGRQLMPR